MIDLTKAAKEFAKYNSSPGIGGRNDLYESLITIQEQAFKAGALYGLEEGANYASEVSAASELPGSFSAGIMQSAALIASHLLEIIEKESDQ